MTEFTPQIFVCSTYSDLVPQRKAVFEAIENLQLQWESMEFFGARSDQPIEACLDQVRRSDVLIVLVGHRYGSLVPEQGISFTEAEYDEGRRLEKTCLVYLIGDDVPILPKHMEMDPQKRSLLERFKGKLMAQHTVETFRSVEDLAASVTRDLEREIEGLATVARSWVGQLRDAMSEAFGQEEGLARWRRYEEAFPAAYQHTWPASDAVEDCSVVEEVLSRGELGMRLHSGRGGAADRFHLRTFEPAIPAPLSNILPRLENMGVTVVAEMPFEVRPLDAVNPVWVRDFELTVDDLEVDVEQVRQRFQDTLTRVWGGEVENDGFNQLVLRAGLDWRQVMVLRACGKYLKQLGIAFSEGYMIATLARYPRVVGLLIELFEALFDPSRQSPSEDSAETPGAALTLHLMSEIEAVERLDEDRILRRFLNMIQCTVRTNFFQTARDDRPRSYLSLKLDGQRLFESPMPRPWVEIFVYSPEVEAVHLRGGEVARGGVRWSDRREDFRTEILDLMKAQTVKNAVIVPVGAKGGFVVKRPPRVADDQEQRQHAVSCYQTMLRGLLDLTDNLEDGKVIPPPEVVRYDGDDPYLVVAADKGTATFSDIANQVALEYGFWLGDAFASGGSVGYDHKRMGITARGAWESVKRHFREMGRDVQREDFTAVGVGDMSGDVFGNGMLLSKHTRLIAAFNHRHIFVDPDPDPAASHAERRRLFELPRSQWTDYDPQLLSAGGMVVDRNAKSIALSPEIRQVLGVPRDTVTPDELIRAILRAAVDLLWLGGIGTYVKASFESHAETGDWANASVQIDAAELGCKVVGEGANLGLTQAGRIEFALRGGRLNTDFIDNSAGVGTSDREINVKLALDEAVASHGLSLQQRDRQLASMTGEVAEVVLRDNYLQAQAVSLVEAHGAALLDEQTRLMRTLERGGLIDRRLEGLPDEGTLLERRNRRLGLTRPEIGVLLSYSKIHLYDELVQTDLPDESRLVDDLRRYFPPTLARETPAALEGHRLRREIIANRVANSLAHRMGPTFAVGLAEETGADLADVARAYLVAREVFAARSIWEEIESLDDRVPAALQQQMHLETTGMLERVCRWLLRREARMPVLQGEEGATGLDLSRCIEAYESDVLVVVAQLRDLLPPRAKARLTRRYKRLRDAAGVPAALAMTAAGLGIMPAACDVALCARKVDISVERMARVYFALGERFGVDRLRRAAAAIGDSGRWGKAAVTFVVDDLLKNQAELASRIARRPESTRQAIRAWTGERAAAVQRYKDLLADLTSESRIDINNLTVAERELRQLLAS